MLDGFQVIGKIVFGMFVLEVLLVSLGVRHLRLQQNGTSLPTERLT